MAYARRQIEDSMTRFTQIAEQAAEELRQAAERWEVVAREAAEQVSEVARVWEREILGDEVDKS